MSLSGGCCGFDILEMQHGSVGCRGSNVYNLTRRYNIRLTENGSDFHSIVNKSRGFFVNIDNHRGLTRTSTVLVCIYI